MKTTDPSDSQQLGFPGGFSVLMSVYRGDDIELFERAVCSVYRNTLLPDAFILVVDGPVSEALHDKIERLRAEYRFDVLQLPSNVGLACALNVGLKSVRTQWVVRADADDYNICDRFARQAAAVIESGDSIDLIGGSIQEVEKDGTHVAVRSTVTDHESIRRFAAYRNPFNHMTVAYRTELALRCGGYPDIHLKEDYALWAQMLACGGRTLNLSEILVIATAGRGMYRRRGGLRYAVSEISLQRHLVRTGLKSAPSALIQGVGRSLVFMFPATLRGWIYEKFLRR